jgi:hypothetical protein
MPVPIIRTITSFFPRPAPRQLSPSTAAFRSLSTTTGKPSFSCSRFASGMRAQPFKFGAHTVPFRRTSPGTATPTAAIAPGSPERLLFFFARFTNFESWLSTLSTKPRAISTICRTGALAEVRSTGTLTCRAIFPARSTNAPASFVPPKSIATTY